MRLCVLARKRKLLLRRRGVSLEGNPTEPKPQSLFNIDHYIVCFFTHMTCA